MSKYFYAFIEILKNAWQDDFLKGIMVGIGGYIILVLLVHLMFIIFGRKKCNSLTIPGDNGNVIVSIKAITGILKQELARFSQLEISRINVFKHKKGFLIEIRSKFHVGSSGTPEIYTGVSEEVKKKMNSIFGIDNIHKVDLRIDSCKTDEESNTDLSFTPGMR